MDLLEALLVISRANVEEVDPNLYHLIRHVRHYLEVGERSELCQGKETTNINEPVLRAEDHPLHRE